jgi:hypothetical protein
MDERTISVGLAGYSAKDEITSENHFGLAILNFTDNEAGVMAAETE